jgi:hypothetical protein
MRHSSSLCQGISLLLRLPPLYLSVAFTPSSHLFLLLPHRVPLPLPYLAPFLLYQALFLLLAGFQYRSVKYPYYHSVVEIWVLPLLLFYSLGVVRLRLFRGVPYKKKKEDNTGRLHAVLCTRICANGSKSL